MPKKLIKNTLIVQTKSQTILENHGRHSYNFLTDLDVQGKDLSRTLLNNCCLHNCQFFCCKMDSVDFQGTEFKNCKFVDVSFEGADITSCNFINCVFEKCTISYSNLIDNNFLHCLVKSIVMVDATITNNIWTQSEFFNFAPIDTTLYSNDFIKCKFVESKLLTAFYYTIFDKCSFMRSEIDSYILGFQFGLKKKDFRNLNIEHFGQKNIDFNSAMRLMNAVYGERQLPLENKLLGTIISKNTGADIEELIKLIFYCIENGYVVKVDEIRFIRKITNNLYRGEKISLFYYLFIIDYLNSQPLSTYRGVLSDNVFNEITILYHLLYSIKMDIESGYVKLSEILNEQLKCDDNLLIEFGYKKRPSYRVFDIVCKNAGLIYHPVQERTGSFYEVYQIVKEVVEVIAAVTTVLGVSVTGIVSLARKSFKRKKKKNPQSDSTKDSDADERILKNAIVEEIVANETLQVVEKKVIERYNEDNITVQKETIYRNTMQTVIIHKKEFVRDYDSKNLKNISFK